MQDVIEARFKRRNRGIEESESEERELLVDDKGLN